MIKKLKRAFRTIRERRAKPLHVEFNLTDHCNLNCKGCSHFSPLAPAEYQPLEELETSMEFVSRAEGAEKIEGVYLIGGETLLYPRLKEAMGLARKYFPGAKISIFTNGILIPKMDGEFWEVCRQTGSVIAVTRYPLRFDYERAETICRDKGIGVEVFGDRGVEDTFFRLPLDSRKRQRGWLSHFRCGSFGCITIDNGKIFPCPQAACVGHLNRRFGTDFRWEPGDYIAVEDLKDVKELMRLRNRPVPFCKYCLRWEPTKYGPSKRAAEEWIER